MMRLKIAIGWFVAGCAVSAIMARWIPHFERYPFPAWSNLLPGTILVVLALIGLGGRARKRLLATVFWGFAIIGLGFWAFNLGEVFGEAYAYIDRDPSIYGERIADANRYSHGLRMSHFPPEIPESVRDVVFYAKRDFDLTLLQLRVYLPPEQVKEILREYTPQAKHIQSGCSARAPQNDEYLFTEFRNRENTGFSTLPADFQVLVLDAGLQGGESAVSWQFNYNSGVAVSTTRNEVIYWATSP